MPTSSGPVTAGGSPPPPASASRPLRAAAILVSTLLLAALLLRFPPADYPALYPQCPIHSLFHLRCPGCGTTRALFALLHGHPHEALDHNPLTTCLVPIAPILFFTRRRVRLTPSPSLLSISFVGTALFTIARNL